MKFAPGTLLPLCGFTPEAPLLLVTAFSPVHQGGGAVILRSLIGEPPPPNLVWASLAPRDGDAVGRVSHRRSDRSAWRSTPMRMAGAIDRVAVRHGARAIWIVAHGPVLPAVAPLVERFGYPVHLTVHDDPAWAVAFRTRRELPLTPLVLCSFGRAVRAATSIDAISEGMRTDLSRRFGVDSTVVHRVVDGPVPRNTTYDQQTAALSVGILGSLYAPRQLDVLLRAVALAAERVAVPGRVVIIGREDPRIARLAASVAAVDVTFTGHLAESDGVEVLRSLFALYLGYPFGLRARVLRRTSFPTKLGTYLLAARPLLLHTPADSTLAPLAESAPFAIPWLDEDAGRGADVLVRAWADDAMHAGQDEAAERLRATFFSGDNRGRLATTLEVLRVGRAQQHRGVG